MNSPAPAGGAVVHDGRLALVCYAYYADCLDRLLRLAAAYFGDSPQPQLVLVRAAHLPPCRPALAAAGLQATELVTDGEGWEWGAYQRGLDHLLAAGWTGPVAVFNDTCGVHYPWRPAENAALRRAALQPGAGAVLAGHVQTAPPGFVYRGMAVGAWVRSNAFVLTPAAIAALEGRLYVAADFHAPQVGSDGLAWPGYVSPALARYADEWLLSTGKHGWRHHAGRTEVPPALLRNKAGAILMEKRMSACVLAAGGRLQHCGPPADGRWNRMALRAFLWQRRLRARAGATHAVGRGP